MHSTVAFSKEPHKDKIYEENQIHTYIDRHFQTDCLISKDADTDTNYTSTVYIIYFGRISQWNTTVWTTT